MPFLCNKHAKQRNKRLQLLHGFVSRKKLFAPNYNNTKILTARNENGKASKFPGTFCRKGNNFRNIANNSDQAQLVITSTATTRDAELQPQE